MLIFNDTHVAAVRSGGTTPQSASALKKYLRNELERLLNSVTDNHAVCNGDLFDRFEIETSELIATYELFNKWLCSQKLNKLTLIMGNHDYSARGDKVSSFHLLSFFLKAQHPTKFRMIDHNDGFCHVSENVWAISHQLNQDLFALEVQKAIALGGTDKYLLLHCNVKNTFALHSDHSLNLTDELLTPLMVAGWTLIVGHEHQGYQLRGGRVVVTGNQFPSSIADCLGEKEKRAVLLSDTGVEFVKTWEPHNSYVQIDWRDLKDSTVTGQFIRIVGDATAEESAQVVSAISKYRQRSDAFVVTNAVTVEGIEAIEELTEASIESIKAFDVLSAILEQLDEKEQVVVKELVNAQ